jgi:hypothetical protein
MVNHVRARFRHGKLNITRALRRHVQTGKEPCHHPTRRGYGVWQRPLMKLLLGIYRIVGAELARDLTHANHPHYDGSTACDRGSEVATRSGEWATLRTESTRSPLPANRMVRLRAHSTRVVRLVLLTPRPCGRQEVSGPNTRSGAWAGQ